MVFDTTTARWNNNDKEEKKMPYYTQYLWSTRYATNTNVNICKKNSSIYRDMIQKNFTVPGVRIHGQKLFQKLYSFQAANMV